jgi:hypothetical protein
MLLPNKPLERPDTQARTDVASASAEALGKYK